MPPTEAAGEATGASGRGGAGPAIELKDLGRAYGERVALSGVTIDVPAGSTLAVFGANGAGKTTLLRIVTGDLVPHAGAVTRSGGLGVMRQFVGHGGMDETVADLLLSVSPERVRAATDAGDDEDEVRELDGDLIDVEPAIRDTVVPALPFQPLDDPDCPGLCSECGVRLADDPDHTHEILDPRWSALSGLAGVQDETKES